MVIAMICGGLGNQMFQYAMARRLAHSRGVELKLDLGAYAGATDRPAGLEGFSRTMRLQELCIAAMEATALEIAQVKDPHMGSDTISRIVRQLRKIKPDFLLPATHVQEKQYRVDPAMLELSGNVYLFGYWQSHRYFADASDLIRAEFKPKDSVITRYASEFVDHLRASGGPVVSLHVRRGDLAHASEKLGKPHMVHGVPVGTEYIQAAMARFGADSRFLVFSDTPADIEWCRQNIQAGRLHFSQGHSDIQDMAIMSACDHHIIANSTYSWWAAWLNARPGRRVIAPKQWSGPNAKMKMVTDDLIPADWETI